MPADDNASQVFGLAEILRILRRRWRWVAGSVVVCTGLVLTLSLQQQAEYEATAKVLLRNATTDQIGVSQDVSSLYYLADRNVQNQLQVIDSADLRKEVEGAYKGDVSVSDVSAEPAALLTDAVNITVRAPAAEDAAKLANLYASTYVDFIRNDIVDSALAVSTEIQERIDDVRARRDSVAAPLTDLDKQIAASPGNQSLQVQRASLQTQLQAQLDSLDQQIESYSNTLERVTFQANVAGYGGAAKVLEQADVPGSPVSPKPIRDGIIGVMLGLGVGLGLALAREFLDERVRTADDIERVLKGRAPVLGVIPEASEVEVNGLADASAHTAVAEAYRALRTAVKFAELDRSMRVIQVTSGSQGEGKTTTAANLALMLTQAGHRVVVVCCDLRRPQIHERFGAALAPGLADVVLGDCTLADAVQSVGELLYVLPAGQSPPNPSELLGSGRAERVIAALAEEMDYVIIDTTPVLPVTDSIVVSRFVDATVMVVAANTTTRNEVSRTVAALDLAQAPLVGVVLNRSELSDRNAYGYTYGRGGYSRKSTYASTRSGRSGGRKGRRKKGAAASPAVNGTAGDSQTAGISAPR
jgi:capsular exopolysaccharide synthesis family protein